MIMMLPSTGTLTIAISPTNGKVVINDNGTPNNPNGRFHVTYTSNANYGGRYMIRLDYTIM